MLLATLIVGSSGAATLALGAGVLNGSFATPTRFMTRWKWENVWALWAVLAMFVFPWIVAFATVPHLIATYQTPEVRHALLLVIAFGAGYGIAAICFGLGVDAIGIALNFAIALGTATAVGSAIPLVWFHSASIYPAGAGHRRRHSVDCFRYCFVRGCGARQRTGPGEAVDSDKTSRFVQLCKRTHSSHRGGGWICTAKFWTCFRSTTASPRRRTRNRAKLSGECHLGSPSYGDAYSVSGFLRAALEKESQLESFFRPKNGTILVTWPSDGQPLVFQHRYLWRGSDSYGRHGTRSRMAAFHVRNYSDL